jgi:GH15 family glucan-1,4-alpha-glucosidase
MSDHSRIADHGLIGNLQTAALVSTDGTVDWFCAPRFDSPSVFGALLDSSRGGHCRVKPRDDAFEVRQLYFPDTAVLVTRFMTEAGVGELIDFMPLTGRTPQASHQLVRMLHCVRGRITFDVEIAPRFDYGREPHTAHVTDEGVVFEGARGTSMTVDLVREPGDAGTTRPRADAEGDVRGEVALNAGEARGLVLDVGAARPPRLVSETEVRERFDATVAFWQTWLGQSTYRGRWRETLERSAITLKLLTYAPTGALVAAPTAGLPEQVGGERNWDYRFTWIRDASFSVYSLLGMGFRDEAAALSRWMRERLDEQAGGAESPLQIMYRVDGSSDLSEEVLDHWEGYRGSRPVRIGNGAAGQLQLDIFGEALDSVYAGDSRDLRFGEHGWRRICDLLEWVTDNWDQPEEGIWETRGGRQDFTYGRLMNWVALDRGIRLAERHGRPAPLETWRRERDAIYNQVMDRGWSSSRRAFRQHYASDVLDASLLRMSSVGFIAPTDTMWLSTLAAMEDELVVDSLVYRYDPAASPDGLRGSEGTFSLCTFAYVGALATSGQVRKARVTFEKMLTYANHLGLFSEEIAPTGEQIGNFPQAFTHLALIDAGIALDRHLDDDQRTVELPAYDPSGKGGAPPLVPPAAGPR